MLAALIPLTEMIMRVDYRSSAAAVSMDLKTVVSNYHLILCNAICSRTGHALSDRTSTRYDYEKLRWPFLVGLWLSADLL